MNYKYYIGADISKHTLDFTLLQEGNFVLHKSVSNTKQAIEQWLKEIMTTHKAGGKKTLYCVERTGAYQEPLLKALIKRKAALWLENPLQIHLTLGLQRGKSDKIDSGRIAEYAYTYRRRASLWQQPREVILHLKQLRSLRERLVSIKKQLRQETIELKGFVAKSLQQSLIAHCKGSLQAVEEDLMKVEKSMAALITSDERLTQLYGWLISVFGIGKVLATELIITTNEFKNFSSPKKYACYCGIAPFRYTSGTSLNSKARVSKRANQRMKRLLHIAAMSCVRRDSEYKQYYERRLQQGLSKMSVINVIRNKIIHRAFACVREERLYIKSH